jgi:hypothetical protein
MCGLTDGILLRGIIIVAAASGASKPPPNSGPGSGNAGLSSAARGDKTHRPSCVSQSLEKTDGLGLSAQE